MEKLLEILKSYCPATDLSVCESLIDDEILDSFDLVGLAGEIMEEFDIELDIDDIVPENFNSAKAIMAMIESKKKQ